MKGYIGMMLVGIAIGILLGTAYVYNTNPTCKPPGIGGTR